MNEHSTPATNTTVRRLLPLGLLLLALAGLAWLSRPDGRLRVTFLETPGDAVLIQTPRGGFVLVDGGGDAALLALHLGRRLPFWRRHLDAVILTRGDHGRLPGQIAALARYEARLAIAPPQLPASPTTHEWLRLLDAQGAPVRAARPPERIALDGVTLTLLDGGDGDGGLVLALEYGATRLVLAGAIGEDAEPALLARAHPVAVLAYPWQRPLDTPLLAAWQPRALIFTSAYEAHDPVLLTTRERAVGGAAVYHEQFNGAVTVVSDGRRTWVETER